VDGILSNLEEETCQSLANKSTSCYKTALYSSGAHSSFFSPPVTSFIVSSLKMGFLKEVKLPGENGKKRYL
jgi:hypothetical protein